MHVNRKQNRTQAKNAIKTGKAFSEQQKKLAYEKELRQK